MPIKAITRTEFTCDSCGHAENVKTGLRPGRRETTGKIEQRIGNKHYPIENWWLCEECSEILDQYWRGADRRANAMNHMAYARFQTVAVAVQLMPVVAWINDNKENLDNRTVMVLGAFIADLSHHATTILNILNAPTVIQPIAGKRCMFY